MFLGPVWLLSEVLKAGLALESPLEVMQDALVYLETFLFLDVSPTDLKLVIEFLLLLRVLQEQAMVVELEHGVVKGYYEFMERLLHYPQHGHFPLTVQVMLLLSYNFLVSVFILFFNFSPVGGLRVSLDLLVSKERRMQIEGD